MSLTASSLAELAEQDAWAGRKRFVDVGGLELAYVDIPGEGRPLLLIHGFTDTSLSFSLLAPYLAGHRLVMPDLRGHGASQAGRGFGVADFAADMAGLIRSLGLDRPLVVGHSLGAMVSIALAARHPELIGGLMLLAGTLRTDFPPDHPLVLGVEALRDPIAPTDPFYDWWHACEAAVPQAFLAGLARDASGMPAARWRAILAEIGRADLTADARAVQPGTRIIAGGRDPLFGEAQQNALVRALPAASLVWARECGHNPHWENPVHVAEIIRGTDGAAKARQP